jgi:hypothetical protein
VPINTHAVSKERKHTLEEEKHNYIHIYFLKLVYILRERLEIFLERNTKQLV